MFRRYVLIKVEGIKQSVLVAAVFSHHAGALPPPLLLTNTLKTQSRSIVFQRNRSGSDARHVYVTHRARISLTWNTVVRARSRCYFFGIYRSVSVPSNASA